MKHGVTTLVCVLPGYLHDPHQSSSYLQETRALVRRVHRLCEEMSRQESRAESNSYAVIAGWREERGRFEKVPSLMVNMSPLCSRECSAPVHQSGQTSHNPERSDHRGHGDEGQEAAGAAERAGGGRGQLCTYA